MPAIETILSFVLVGILIGGLLWLLGKDKSNVNGCCAGTGESLEKKVCESRHE